MDISARMLILSFLSCLDCNETDTGKIESNIANLLNSTKEDLTFTNIVWGPIAHKTQNEIFTDALVFAIHDKTINNTEEYTIVFRGTNPFSISSWLFQDLNISGLTPWSRQSVHTTANDAYISKATDTSLSIHTKLNSNGQTILDWIQSIYNTNKKYIFNITGHSLGGCMSATFALWLFDELKYSNQLKNIVINVFPFAGPTAGNINYAKYSDSCLKLTRYANKFDIVTHAWLENDMVDLPNIYKPITPNNFEETLITALAQQVNALNYSQPGSDSSIDSSVFDHIPFKEYLLQAAFQHVVPYLEYAFKRAPIKLIKVVMDIIKSLLDNDKTLFTRKKLVSPSPSILQTASYSDPVPKIDNKALFHEEIQKYLNEKLSL